MPGCINGTGTKWYGMDDFNGGKSYITTEWVVLFWLPIIPLNSVRILSGGRPSGWNETEFEIEKVPLNIKQVFKIYICVYGSIALFYLLSKIVYFFFGGSVAGILILVIFASYIIYDHKKLKR